MGAAHRDEQDEFCLPSVGLGRPVSGSGQPYNSYSSACCDDQRMYPGHLNYRADSLGTSNPLVSRQVSHSTRLCVLLATALVW